MGSAGISFTLLPPLACSAWLGAAMPLPGINDGVGVGVGVRVVSDSGAGGGGMKDGVGEGVNMGVEMGISTGIEVGDGRGGRSDIEGVGVELGSVVVDTTNVVRGRSELEDRNDGVGVCDGV